MTSCHSEREWRGTCSASPGFVRQPNGEPDVACDRASREIELLREYRTRLIADVVTGKLDVREVAARLPDDAEASEPLDEADALVDGDDEAGETDIDGAAEEAVA